MAVTHTWSVDSRMKTRTQDGHDDVVFQISWSLESEDTVDGKTYRTRSGNQITLDTSDLSSFTPFADLTESEVVGWAKSFIDAQAAEGEGVTCAEWEAGHERNIAKQINPPTQTKTAPWATPE
jgi:hypothetical protein